MQQISLTFCTKDGIFLYYFVFANCHFQTIDGFAKNRHSGENRSPETLQLIEKTGFSDKSENDKKWFFSTFYETIKIAVNNIFEYDIEVIKL